MKSGFQTTLNDRVSLEGIGVHSGKPVSITLHPSEANSGIVFLRTHLENGREREILAHYPNVIDTRLCTVVGDPLRGSVATRAVRGTPASQSARSDSSEYPAGSPGGLGPCCSQP